MRTRSAVISLIVAIFAALAVVSCGGGGGGGDTTGGNNTNTDTTAPTVPSNVQATATSLSSMALSWDAATDAVGVAGYKIYRGGTYLKSVATTTSSDYSLTASTQYCYTISAYDAANNESGQSAQSCATTGSASDTTAPTVPTGLTAATASDSRINLFWTASTDNVAVSGYKIYRGGGTFSYIKSVATTTASDTGLTADTYYCYSVSAYDASGNESAMTAQTSQACDLTSAATSTTAPPVPTGLHVTPVLSSQMTVTWSASTGAWGYHVYRDGTLVGTDAVNTTSTTDSGLTASTQYCYSVSALSNTGHESAQCTQVCATTGAASDISAPTVPAGLTAIAGSSKNVTLSWTASTDNVGVLGYKIYKDGTLLKSVTTTSTTDTGLTGGANYCYTVSAYDDSGNESTQSTQACVTIFWTPTESLTNPPSWRAAHSAFWTGTKMLIWGGSDDAAYDSTKAGGIYDPATNLWSAMSTTNAPTARRYHSAVWTDTKMLIWGGYNGTTQVNTGYLYDTASNVWSAMSTTNAPSARYNQATVWTGTKMIVWGGYAYSGTTSYYLNDGAIYDPATDLWSAMSTTNAPSARYNHTAVWTGSKMIVWGGRSLGGNFADGAVYDPAADTWTPLSATNAPAARYNHTAVWTGTKMIVWGGYGTGNFNTGAAYDPTSDTWTPLSTTNAPAVRSYHTAVWTGQKMIVWGGKGDYTIYGYSVNTGGVYNPTTDTWSATPTDGAPSKRYFHSAVWAGDKMIVWGGWDGVVNSLVTGGILYGQ